ncbi:MAG: intermembrane transport protein PqiB [Acetobacteraceae bacterium]
MNDQPVLGEQPPMALVRSRLGRRRRLSLVWAIPAVTAVIGAWLVWMTLAERGPQVTISFQSAEGLTANQSHVRHKDVDMGVVTKIDLSPDMKRVIVTVRMKGEAERLLTEEARFWVVKPRFFAGSISGLQTLVSGAYIELQPSLTGGRPERHFVGLENPPVVQAEVPGRTFMLKAARIGNIGLGSPIIFRDFTVGEVLGWDVAELADSVTIHAFVREPFDRYVHDNSRFWNASAVNVQLGAKGLQVQLESLRALILGGIAFDTPAEGLKAPVSEEHRTFALYPSREAAESARYARSAPLMAVFRSSVAGLEQGSAVTIRGIKIGEVESVGLEYDNDTDGVVAAVRFAVEPGRIGHIEFPEQDKAAEGGFRGVLGLRREETMAGLVQRGLRVRLETASLITGQRQLALDFVAGAEPAPLGRKGDAFIIPVHGDGASDVMSAAGALMSRLASFPFEDIGRNLNQTIAGANALVNDRQAKQTLAALQATLTTAQALFQNVNRGMEPVMARLPGVAAGLDDAVKRTDRLIASLESGYGDKSQINRDISRLMVQLSDAARSIRVLADLLARHPEALIRGRTMQGP